MILVLNCGSSSVKFALYEECAPTSRPEPTRGGPTAPSATARGGHPQPRSGGLRCIFAGEASGLPDAPRLAWHRVGAPAAEATRGQGGAGGADVALDAPCPHARALEAVLACVEREVRRVPTAVGHRVVHGGAQFTAPVRIDEGVVAALEALVPLAPLHQPHNVAGIRAVAEHAPGLPQVACFDTAFHATQPPLHTTLALPARLREAGVRRYGFHGLSYESIAGQLPALLGEKADGRVIVAHLGNGASVCAMRARRSVRTSMSLTPLDGLVMGTRPGAIDIGVALHAMRALGMDEPALSHLLYHESGLLGLSGISNDVRALQASDDPRATFALEVFCERAAEEIAVAAVALGGCDALVFTAGIGEHSAPVRAGIVERLGFLGARLDACANGGESGTGAAGEGEEGEGEAGEGEAGEGEAEGHRARALHAPDSRVALWMVPTDEQEVIARHTLLLADR